MFKKFVGWCALFGIAVCPMYSSASDNFRCSGRFNTDSDYLHEYVISEQSNGEILNWNGTQFSIQENQVWYYAEYIGKTRTDVIYIDKDTLEVNFYSILPGLILYANGTCKKVPPHYLEYTKRYLDGTANTKYVTINEQLTAKPDIKQNRLIPALP